MIKCLKLKFLCRYALANINKNSESNTPTCSTVSAKITIIATTANGSLNLNSAFSPLTFTLLKICNKPIHVKIILTVNGKKAGPILAGFPISRFKQVKPKNRPIAVNNKPV